MKKNTQSTGEKNKGIFTRAAIANSECANGRTCAQNNWILFIAKQRQLHSEGQSMLRIILAVQTNTKKKTQNIDRNQRTTNCTDSLTANAAVLYVVIDKNLCKTVYTYIFSFWILLFCYSSSQQHVSLKKTFSTQQTKRQKSDRTHKHTNDEQP